MIGNNLSANTIRLAKVTHVWPEGQKFEVMFLDNGDYGRDVQVMSPYAGTDFGFTGGIPAPEEEGHDPNRPIDPDKRHIIAVVATVQGRHICLGYLYPQVTHMAFTREQDMNRLIERHTSDVYRTIDDDGNMEIVHPSGAVIAFTDKVKTTVGAAPADGVDMFGDAVTDLEGRDFDGRWELKHNAGKDVAIVLAVGLNSIVIRKTGIFITGNILQNGIHTDSNGVHSD